MAGRAGCRGIDKRGHVGLVQTVFEGAEECYKVLFSGLQPLVSQFTASYGMVLNLLAGAKVTRGSSEVDELNISRAGQTIKEARKLVEQSFGNYVGSNVMIAAKEELKNIESEIEMLTSEVSDEAIDRKSKKALKTMAHKEITHLQQELKAEKRLRTDLRRKMELEKVSAMRPLLKELECGSLPFMCLEYSDSNGVQHMIAAVLLGSTDILDGFTLKKMIALSFKPSTINSSNFNSYQLYLQLDGADFTVPIG